MNNIYFNDYLNVFERVLSYGYHFRYSPNSISTLIARSSFFQGIEKDQDGYAPITTDESFIGKLFSMDSFNLDEVPGYNQCLWAAESYLLIQGETHLTFECIFIYLPLKEMYELFPLYHEMDFSQINEEFQRRYKEQSVLSILTKRYDCSLTEISVKTNIPYNTLYSLKKRRRDIKKIGIEPIIRLANYFHVRVETISEARI